MAQTLDRINAPAFGEIEKMEVLKATSATLDNGMNLYQIKGGTQDVVKLELIFNAGKWFQPQALVAYAANSLMDDGTTSKSAAKIADTIDYYGAYFQSKSDYDWAEVSLYCQVKHLGNLLPLLLEILEEATFPESELAVFKENNKQKLLQNMERVEVLAGNKFSEAVFGKLHPYGNINKPEDYDKLNRDVLAEFYKSRYQIGNARMIVSGMVTEDVIKMINKVFGQKKYVHLTNDDAFLKNKNYIPQPSSERNFSVSKKDAVQSAIRIGKPLFNKTHPDFQGMMVLNTIFGGYFGSRLMSNIREDKGYTYGIHSSISSHLQGGEMVISTEVGTDVTKDAVKEIFVEMNRLQNEKVGEDELRLVKNYLAGSFMRSIDGPFALADRFTGILKYGLGYEYFDSYFNTLKNISSENLLALAQKYYNKEDFYQVLAGSM